MTKRRKRELEFSNLQWRASVRGFKSCSLVGKLPKVVIGGRFFFYPVMDRLRLTVGIKKECGAYLYILWFFGDVGRPL